MGEIYLIKSNSAYLTKEKIKELTEGINDITTFSLDTVSIYDCIEDASYFGLFDEKRALIIKDSKIFSTKYKYEEETDALINFFKNMKDDIIMIFDLNNILKEKEITKKSVSLGAKIIDLTETNIDDIINKYLEENKLKIDNDSLSLLKINSNNNIDIIINEIDKISNISNKITTDLINEYGSFYNYKESSDKVDYSDISFKFSDAIIKKDFKNGFKLLEKLLERGDEIVSLIGLLASSYIEMYKVKEATKLGYQDDEIASLLGYKNPKRVFVMKKNSNIYTLDELKDIIISLSDMDIKIKTGVNPVYGFKELLLNI